MIFWRGVELDVTEALGISLGVGGGGEIREGGRVKGGPYEFRLLTFRWPGIYGGWLIWGVSGWTLDSFQDLIITNCGLSQTGG